MTENAEIRPVEQRILDRGHARAEAMLDALAEAIASPDARVPEWVDDFTFGALEDAGFVGVFRRVSNRGLAHYAAERGDRDDLGAQVEVARESRVADVEAAEVEAHAVEAAARAVEDRAKRHYDEQHESFERSDTDGFLSQWASGLNGDKARVEAALIRAGGVDEFPALFTLDGELVAAKLIDGRYGPVWGILADDDPHGQITAWVNAFPTRKSTITRKGYVEGTVRAPARADITGGRGTGLSGALNCRAVVVRADGGFSRDVEIVSTCVEYDKP